MKNALWMALAVLALLIWREFTNSPPAKKVSETIEKPGPLPPFAPSPSRRDPPAAPEPRMGQVILQGPPAPASGDHPKPPPHSVPFEVMGGLVIAYGDQLLGKPTIENFPQQGFIEAPKVGLWSSGEIAYSFDPAFRNPERVQRVINYFNQNTPVRFVPWTEQKDSIVFTPGEIPLCLSYVGRIGGHQPIYLDDRCYDKEITHELMHALGFIHEQSRPDRDRYLRILWDKIEDDKQSQFEVVPEGMSAPQKDRPFDYQSVMIYNPTDFAKVRGEEVMQSVTGAKIEPTETGLSAEDLARLSNLYPRR